MEFTGAPRRGWVWVIISNGVLSRQFFLLSVVLLSLAPSPSGCFGHGLGHENGRTLVPVHIMLHLDSPKYLTVCSPFSSGPFEIFRVRNDTAETVRTPCRTEHLSKRGFSPPGTTCSRLTTMTTRERRCGKPERQRCGVSQASGLK